MGRLRHHRDISRLRLHAFDPSADLGKVVQRKAAFVGHLRVSEERDVGARPSRLPAEDLAFDEVRRPEGNIGVEE